MKEGDIVRLILDHYRDKDNIKLFRVQCGKVRAKGGWMQFAPEGTPDICGHKDGRFIGIECKFEGKMSASQKLFQEHSAKTGAIYIEARTLKDVIDVIGD